MAKVYVLNKSTHDFSEATRFGELVYCTEGSLGKYNTSQMMRELEAAMKDSQPTDYILLTSLATLCSLACSILAVKHGRVNLLIYKGDGYVERKIVFNK